jgi:hypothetical protein
MTKSTTNFDGIYRGTVKDNTGPRGRCKVFVPGVYPSEYKDDPTALPWSQPAQSLVGGCFTAINAHPEMDLDAPLAVNETGFAGWPHVGAEVWVFFEEGNHSFPIHFAVAQAGKGWISEHEMQWVFKSDNVRIRIDEDPSREGSTSKFDTYNTNGTYLSQEFAEEDVPTRVDLEIIGNVNLHIIGNVNMRIEGDVFEEHIGDKHKTHVGNLYHLHTGDVHHVHTGVVKHEQTGNFVSHTAGNKNISQVGNKDEQISGNRSATMTETDSLTVGTQRQEQLGTHNVAVTGPYAIQVGGTETRIVQATSTETVAGLKAGVYGALSVSTTYGDATSISAGALNLTGQPINLN